MPRGVTLNVSSVASDGTAQVTWLAPANTNAFTALGENLQEYKVIWLGNIRTDDPIEQTVSAETLIATQNGFSKGEKVTVRVDAVYSTGQTAMGTPVANRDRDGDSIADNMDVDVDGNGLIEIRTETELDNVRYVLDGSGYQVGTNGTKNTQGCPEGVCHGYELVTNIDLASYGADYDNGAGWQPIGNFSAPFTAILDGNNFTIGNLTINRPREIHVGLFGGTRAPAEFKNVQLAQVNVTGNGFVGGLVGEGRDVIITNSSVTGTVNGSLDIGGLVGNGRGATIIASYAMGTVNGNANIGGLIGDGKRATIIASYVVGTVSGGGSVGGLVGISEKERRALTITASYAVVNVSGVHFVGGLVGYAEDATIAASSAVANANGGDFVGGLAGHWSFGTITNSSATGTVNGSYKVGGLLGDGPGATITASYAIGTVNGIEDIGGLVGIGRLATIIASYAVVNVSGDDYVGGLLGNGMNATIIASYAVVNVSGDDYVGGLLGNGMNATITNSYAVGMVKGTNNIGGLVGHGRFVNITASYAVGTVSGRSSVGGLLGDGQEATVTAAYWDSEVSGIRNGSYGTPQLTRTLQLPTAATGIYEHWTGSCPNDSTMDAWDFGNTTQYPALNCPPGGADIQPRTQKEALEHLSMPAFDEDSPAAENPILSYDPLAEIFILSWTNPSSIAKGIYFGSLDDAIIRFCQNSQQQLCFSDNSLSIDQGQGQTKIYTKEEFAALGLMADIPYNYVEIELDYARGTNRNATVALVNRKGVYFNPPLSADHVPRGVTLNVSSVASDETAQVTWLAPANTNAFTALGENLQEYKVIWLGDIRTDDPIEQTVSAETLIATQNGFSKGEKVTVRVDAVYSTGQTAMGTPVANRDRDGDSIADNVDVDGDGLIEIRTATELDNVRYVPDGSGYQVGTNGTKNTKGCPAGGCRGYKLVANIDLASYGADYDNGAGWQPIGSILPSFTAIFDGNNFTIGNLTINRPSEFDVGLFSGTMAPAEFRNVQLTQVNVTGNIFVGGLVGYGRDVIITNSSVTGTVKGTVYIGGLIGNGQGATITTSYAVANVSGGSYVGGLVGDGLGPRDGGATIIASYAVVNVNGEDYVGGLLGDGGFATITSSYAVANVSGEDRVGGLVGHGRSVNIAASYAAANVSGDDYVGGLVGDGRKFVTITASYAAANVNGDDYVGGLLGNGPGAAITASYAAANVNGEDYVGGLLGNGPGAPITASYAIGTVNGSYKIGGLLGDGPEATITASSAVVNVSGDDYVGGLLGNGMNATITNSYAVGMVKGTDNIGGLVGHGRFVNITASYAVGTVSGRSSVGGLIGDGQEATVTAAYWDSEVSGIRNGSYGTPQLTRTLQLPTAATGIYENWTGSCLNDPTMGVWDFGNTTQYPALNCPPGGADVQPRTKKEALGQLSMPAFDEDSPAAGKPILSYDSREEVFILSWTNPSSIAKGIYFGSLDDAIIRFCQTSQQQLCLSDNSLNIDQGQGQTKIYTRDDFAALGLRADIPYNYVEIALDYARGTNRNTEVALVNRKGVYFYPLLSADHVPRGVTLNVSSVASDGTAQVTWRAPANTNAFTALGENLQEYKVTWFGNIRTDDPIEQTVPAETLNATQNGFSKGEKVTVQDRCRL